MVDEPTMSNATPGARAGSRFGRYQLRQLLGSGGFGEVYEAEDTTMDRAVALKVLASQYSQNETFRQRLFREARNAGKLNEPHVVPIHHCGEIDGQLYIDMRLIDGSDLQKVLARQGSLSPARAVALVRQIAAALDAAHSVQMVHRDIKPANILLTKDDFAYLVDFGLANAATDASLTSTGMTIGTFAYMAPERFSNTDISPRADIYALACVFYECLTGVPPYPTENLPALINAHLNAPIPRPTERRPELPAGFDDVIAVGMAKDPKNRLDQAGDLAALARNALRHDSRRQADAILGGTEVAPPPARPTGTAEKSAPPPPPQASRSRKAASSALTTPGSVAKPSAREANSAAEPATPARHGLGRGSRRRWTVIGIGAVVVLLLAALAVSRAVIRSEYYVTAYSGTVSIMQGVPGSILGVTLNQPYSQGCLNNRNQLSVIRFGTNPASNDCYLLKTSDLAESARPQVTAGLPTGTLEQADAQLRRLANESLLPLCPMARASTPPLPSLSPPTSEETGANTPTVTALSPPTPEPGLDCRTPE